MVLADPTRKAGEVHCEASIEDTYTTTNQILINRFPDDDTGGGGVLEVTENGTGTICTDDTGCEGQEADKCLAADGAGFCTVERCTAGSCEGNYACCHDCPDFAADLLPFEGSACFPSAQTGQLTAGAMCTCD